MPTPAGPTPRELEAQKRDEAKVVPLKTVGRNTKQHERKEESNKSSGTDPKLVVNMISERIALGPLRSDLLPLYHRWINDFSTLRTLGGTLGPMTLEQEQAWIEAQITSTQRTHQIFTIYERESLQPIGTTSLEEIDDRHRSATFGILIGEATFEGEGWEPK